MPGPSPSSTPAKPAARGPSSFVVSLCRPGFESAVITELSGFGLRMAFRRPGFVSFKVDQQVTSDDIRQLSTIFSRRLGLAVGPFEPEAAAIDRAVDLAEAVGARIFALTREGLLDDEPRDLVDAEAMGVQDAIDDRYPPPPEGTDAPVVEVICVDGEGDEARFIVIKAIGGLLDCPGGMPSLEVPATSPSKGWRNLEDAVRRFDLTLGPSDIAVDLGAAPGGVTRALVDRGLRVMAIDTNPLDPALAAHERVKNLCIPIEKIDLDWLPRATFLFLDVNQPPRSALAALAPIADYLLPSLQSAVLTLKLGARVSLDEIPHWQAIIRRMFPGFDLQLAQLPGNKSDISVGLRRRR
jgi:23S rRNA C2498 (ribose-2'-O)-methylase RlmM